MLQLLMVLYSPQMQLPDDIKAFIADVLKAYYRMAEDLVRSFEKIDIEGYLPELPQIVREAYGQGQPQAAQALEAIMGGLLGQGRGQAVAPGGEIPSGLEAILGGPGRQAP